MLTLSVSFVPCILSCLIFWSQTSNKLTYLLICPCCSVSSAVLSHARSAQKGHRRRTTATKTWLNGFWSLHSRETSVCGDFHQHWVDRSSVSVQKHAGFHWIRSGCTEVTQVMQHLTLNCPAIAVGWTYHGLKRTYLDRDILGHISRLTAGCMHVAQNISVKKEIKLPSCFH